jgi:hypothetical protein
MSQEQRHQRKVQLINGRKCKTCGYSKSVSALCFHHRDPATKQFNISGNNLTKRPFRELVDEVEKCDVLCLNCHAELHDVEGWVHEDGKRTPKTS